MYMCAYIIKRNKFQASRNRIGPDTQHSVQGTSEAQGGHGHGHIPKEPMNQGVFGRDPLVGIIVQHLAKEVSSILIQGWHHFRQLLPCPLRKGGFVVRHRGDPGPHRLVWGAQGAENPEELVYFRIPGKQRPSGDHFGKDTAQTPDVNRRGVIFTSQEDLGSPVPQSHHLVRVSAHRHPKRPRQPEVGQFDLALSVDEQILWFEVPVENPVRVTESQALEQLEQVALDEREGDAGDGGVHEPLQVLVEELEHKVKFVFGVDHVAQLDYVGMVELLQQGDLTDGGARDAFGLRVQSDLLQRDGLSGDLVLGFINHPVRSLADFLHFLKRLHDNVLVLFKTTRTTSVRISSRTQKH